MCHIPSNVQFDCRSAIVYAIANFVSFFRLWLIHFHATTPPPTMTIIRHRTTTLLSQFTFTNNPSHYIHIVL